MNWFFLSILSAAFWGTENFLHKMAAKRGFDSAKVSIIFGITVCFLSLGSFYIFKETISEWSYLIFISLLNAVAFFTSFITRLEALKKLKASVFFPISKTATLFMMSLISFAILGERLSAAQTAGLLLTLLAVYLLAGEKGTANKLPLRSGAVILTILSALFAALANFTTDRLQIHNIGTYAFTFFAYAFGFMLSYIFKRTNITAMAAQKPANQRGKIAIYQIGIAIGILNFFGLVFFIEALRSGPFAIVGAINNFSLLLTIALSMLIFSEKISKLQIGGIILAFVSLFLFQI